MRNRRLRVGLTLLLSATVFLGSVIPPAIQHAHANGSQSHDHDHQAHADHTHLHLDTHSSHESPSESFQAEHCHLTFLGWDLHLPSSNSPELPSPGSKCLGDQSETLIRLIDTNIVLVLTPTFEWLEIDFSLDSPLRAAKTDSVLLQRGRMPLASLPLCDSARGQRSGVQLI